jgi:tRNA pseudouridine55 synthase
MTVRDNPDPPVPPLAGLIIIDKPVGISSAAAVAVVRRCAGGAKVGHAGTLDPLASGVLVLGIGRATRLLGRLMDLDKRYQTVIDLSAFTTSDDREGERCEVAVSSPPREEQVRGVLARFIGRVAQRPPAYSAVKVGGQRAYRLARRAARQKQPALTLPPREVVIHSIELVSYRWPLLEIDIRCGKGTYIRSMARDIGLALGTGGHCASLRRSAVGPLTLDMAHLLGELPGSLGANDLLAVNVIDDLRVCPLPDDAPSSAVEAGREGIE